MGARKIIDSNAMVVVTPFIFASTEDQCNLDSGGEAVVS